MKIIVIHYNEIALKGKNRFYFENLLVKNIKRKVSKLVERVKKQESRVIVEYKKNEEKIIEELKKVFGIAHFGVGISTKRNLEDVCKYLKKNIKEFENKTFKVDSKRSDKSFELTSMEINKKVGEVLHEEHKLKVDLKNPQIRVNIEVLKKEFFVYFRKIKGLGGLPVGSSGKVLCLLSGGIDSVVASLLMMKRGCKVDFLHIAAIDEKNFLKSKIPKIVKKLEEFGNSGKLYFVNYDEFYKKTFDIDSRYELVLFRRFIYSLAQRLARENEILGIVSGDSLAQVASQTMHNMYAATYSIDIPIYRPLIGFDKVETIKLAKEYRVFKLSIEEYKDCCSIASIKSPSTRAKLEKIDGLAKEVDLEKVIEKTFKKMKTI